MVYYEAKAAVLMSVHTHRHLFLPRFRATIPHRRENWMCKMGSLFEPSE